VKFTGPEKICSTYLVSTYEEYTEYNLWTCDKILET